MSLTLRALLFTVVVPGAGGLYAPWLIVTSAGPPPADLQWAALVPISVGAGLYAWCLWLFATIGRGTPATWDAPRQIVTRGPYGWVRNPIYLAALLIVLGETWLFLSWSLFIYVVVLALGFQLLVVGYEEPTLKARFGAEYEAYRRRVPRWIPRRRRPR